MIGRRYILMIYRQIIMFPESNYCLEAHVLKLDRLPKYKV
jgi:hypothetical protein